MAVTGMTPPISAVAGFSGRSGGYGGGGGKNENNELFHDSGWFAGFGWGRRRHTPRAEFSDGRRMAVFT